MPREISIDWPWPGEWETIEDVSNFYKDKLYPALSEFVAGEIEAQTYLNYVQGPFTIANLTIGSVLFASTGGVVSQDNDDFFWDATNIRLGINVGTSPSVTLDVSGDCKFDGAVTINDSGADKDFRVEGNTATQLLVADAGTDAVRIGTTTAGVIAHFATGGTVFNEDGADRDFRIESDDDANMFFINADGNLIGIREGTPTALVHLTAASGNTVPALNLEAGANGEIVTPDGQSLRVGHWDGSSTFTERLLMDASGIWYIPYLSTGSVVYSGANGELKQDANVFYYAEATNRLGIGQVPQAGLHVISAGVAAGGGSALEVIALFEQATAATHTAISINALTGRDPILYLAEADNSIWDLRNDASATDTFNIRYQVGEANRTDFTIDNSGNVEIVSGKLSMDTAIATAIDIGNSFTGSQVTMTGSSATDHAIEIDGVYSAALIYTHTSSATADTMLWGDMASTATTGDFNGLRPRLTCNAASGGLNARSVYGEVIVGASKYAALAQGVLAHVSYAAGSCAITDIHALGAHISQGASLTATNLYGIIATIQTRGDETISGNDYAMRLDNEAVGGNGRQMDGGIQLVNTNMGGGTYGFTYGLDLSGADIATADIILQNSETISNTTDGLVAFSSKISAATGSTIGTLTLADGSITDSSNAIDFGNEALSTTGTVTGANLIVSQNSDTVTLSHNGSSAYFKTSDGSFIFQTDEGDNTNTVVKMYGKGTGRGIFYIYDEDNSTAFKLTATGNQCFFDASGATALNFISASDGSVNTWFYPSTTAGNPTVGIYGWDAGSSSAKYGTLGINASGTFEILAEDGEISFDDENLSTTGTLSTGAADFGDGGTTNYATFAADGELTLHGTARVTKDLWIPFNALKAPGTKPATYGDHGISGTYSFADATDDTVVANIRIPNDMDRSVVPVISIGWSSTTADPGDDSKQAVWQLEYLYRQEDEDTTVAAQETLTVTASASTTAEGLVLSGFSGVDLPHADDVCLYIRLKRLGADGDDDLGDVAELHGICMEYTSNKQGTAT